MRTSVKNVFSPSWWNTPVEKIYCGNWVDYDAPRWYLYIVVPLAYLAMLAIAIFFLTRPGAFSGFWQTDQPEARSASSTTEDK